MYDIERGIVYRWLMIDAMRDDVWGNGLECGVNVVGVAVVRWGYVRERVDLGS
jgi:hypothetical protein